jgi:hypothetical protein
MVFKSIIGLASACLVVISFNTNAELTDYGTHTADDNTRLLWTDLSDTFSNTRNIKHAGGIYEGYLADTRTILDSGNNTINQVSISKNESDHLNSTAPVLVQDIPAPFLILLLGLSLIGLVGFARLK